MSDAPPEQEVMTFGKMLRQHRLAGGLTQEALAERSGLGIRSIQGLERDESRPRRNTIGQLVGALGLTSERAAALEWAGQPAPRARHVEARADSPTHPNQSPVASADNTVPVQLTSFIGRERERAMLGERLQATRLLTLTGTGGCGKTRLALQLASDVRDQFDDGVWFVSLAGLADPTFVAQTIAVTLGIREAAGRPVWETLRAALRSRRLLLLLDNCEHLIDACAEIADAMLRACPGVQVVATSREPLSIDGEVAWRVPSLTVPPHGDHVGADDLLASEAGRLFVDRARAAEPTFVLSEANAPAVAKLCHRLDGIPLAIELAARRVTALSVEQIGERLDQRFQLLTGGSRAALPRQQTLLATVEWSYYLLSAAERALFDRLAVFAGGFSMAAAEAICDGEAIADSHGTSNVAFHPAAGSDDGVLDLLGRLVDKSLVVAEACADGTKRYRLLETLRQFGRERLMASNQLGAVRRRHAAYFQRFAEEAGSQILGREQVAWLDWLDRDRDNLHAALRWAIETGDAEVGLRMAAGLAYYWYFRGHYSEGRALRAAVLAVPGDGGLAPLRSEVLQGGGLLALHLGEYQTARALLDESVACARSVGEPRLLASALATFGFVTRVQREYDLARPALVEALALAREAGDSFHTAMSLHHLGLVALECDADADTAWSLNQESLKLYAAIGNRRMVGLILLALGRVAHLRRDVTAARALISDALSLVCQVGDFGQVPQVAYHFAALAAEDGDLEQAVCWAGCAAALNEREGTRVWPVIQGERDLWLEGARSRLGKQRFADAWTSGRSLTREQIIAELLEAGGHAPETPPALLVRWPGPPPTA